MHKVWVVKYTCCGHVAPQFIGKRYLKKVDKKLQQDFMWNLIYRMCGEPHRLWEVVTLWSHSKQCDLWRAGITHQSTQRLWSSPHTRPATHRFVRYYPMTAQTLKEMRKLIWTVVLVRFLFSFFWACSSTQNCGRHLITGNMSIFMENVYWRCIFV